MKVWVAAALICAITVLGCIGPEPAEVITTPQKPATTITTTTLRPEIQTFKDAVKNSDVLKCHEFTNQKEMDLCIKDIAVKESKDALCDGIKTASTKDLCYRTIGISKKDRSICEKVSSESVRQNCLRYV